MRSARTLLWLRVVFSVAKAAHSPGGEGARELRLFGLRAVATGSAIEDAPHSAGTTSLIAHGAPSTEGGESRRRTWRFGRKP